MTNFVNLYHILNSKYLFPMYQTKSTIKVFKYSLQFGSKREKIAILINIACIFFFCGARLRSIKKLYTIQSKHKYHCVRARDVRNHCDAREPSNCVS